MAQAADTTKNGIKVVPMACFIVMVVSLMALLALATGQIPIPRYFPSDWPLFFLGNVFFCIFVLAVYDHIGAPAAEPKPNPYPKPANRRHLGPWVRRNFNAKYKGDRQNAMFGKVSLIAGLPIFVVALAMENHHVVIAGIAVAGAGLCMWALFSASESFDTRARAFICPHCDKTFPSNRGWQCIHCHHQHNFPARQSFLTHCANKGCRREQDYIECGHCQRNIALLPDVAPPKTSTEVHREEMDRMTAEYEATQLALQTTQEEEVREGILIGYSEEYQKPVTIPDFPASKVRLGHTYIRGTTGSGKTNAVKHISAQDLNDHEKGMVIIGPEPEMFHSLLAYVDMPRAQDLIYFDPMDARPPIIGFNIFDFRNDERDPYERQANEVYKMNEVAAVLVRSLTRDLGTTMEELIINAAKSLVLLEGASVRDIRAIVDPATPTIRNRVLALPNLPIDLGNFWANYGADRYHHNSVDAVINRCKDIFAEPLATVLSHSSFTWEQVFEEPRIVFVDLSRLPEGQVRNTTANLCLASIQAALKRREGRSTRNMVPYSLFIDEFAEFITAGDSVKSMMRLARKQLCAIHLAHHTSHDMSNSLLSSISGLAETRIVFRLNDHGDANSLVKGTNYSADYVCHQDDGHAVVVTAGWRSGVSVQFPLFPERESATWDHHRRELRHVSKQTWGIKKEDVGAKTSTDSPPDDFWQ